MDRVKKILGSGMAAALTGVVMIMPLLTCIFILHQPKLPEEMNDFRKYYK